MDSEKRQVIIGNGHLITLGKNNREIENGGIYAENGIIQKVGETDLLRDEYPEAEFIDMKGKLMLPGNVIAHTHLYSSFARGMALKDSAPSNFVEILERLWWRLDLALSESDVYFSAMTYLIQCIKSGTTTIIDHHASPSFIDGSLDVIAKAVFESGIRASLCYEVTDRNGPEGAEAGIAENVRFLEKCREYNTSYLTGAMGIHASFTVGDETLKKCIDEAVKLDAPLHIHVEEDLSDRLDSEEKYGVPVLERLHKLGATKVPILACHCVHLADSEYEILKKNNIVVIHNPESNMNNAVGVAPVVKMLEKGITVGLGTDGMTADLFQEMKVLPLLQKLKSGDPRTYSFDQIYETIFLNNPKIAALFWKEAGVGSLDPGNYADVIGLEYYAPTPVTAGNILGHILFGINSSMVDTTIVNGQILMQERKLMHIDEEKINSICRDIAPKMWERF